MLTGQVYSRKKAHNARSVRWPTLETSQCRTKRAQCSGPGRRWVGPQVLYAPCALGRRLEGSRKSGGMSIGSRTHKEHPPPPQKKLKLIVCRARRLACKRTWNAAPLPPLCGGGGGSCQDTQDELPATRCALRRGRPRCLASGRDVCGGAVVCTPAPPPPARSGQRKWIRDAGLSRALRSATLTKTRDSTSQQDISRIPLSAWRMFHVRLQRHASTPPPQTRQKAPGSPS